MKTITHIIYTSLTLILFVGSNAIADGLPIENGHFKGETIVIELNENQQEIIKNNYEPWGDFQLTETQRDIIKNKTSMNPPPTKLMLVKIQDTIGECSCGVSNLGLIIGPNIVEIPTKYIVTDEQAEMNKIGD